MKRETEKLLHLGLELPPAERAQLAQELLRSAGLERPTLDSEIAEPSAAYGEFTLEPKHTMLGSYSSRNLWDATRAFRETTDLREAELEEVFEEVRQRSQQRKIDSAMAHAKAALARLGKGPRVVRLEVEPGIDQNGKAVADVRVVLEDHPRGRLYPWDQLKPIHQLIWQAFLEKAEGGPWPFVNFEQESESKVVEDEAIAV